MNWKFATLPGAMAVVAMAAACVTMNPADRLTQEEIKAIVSEISAFEHPVSQTRGKITSDGKFSACDNRNCSDGTLTVSTEGKLCYNFSSPTWTSGCYDIYRTATPNTYIRSPRNDQVIFSRKGT